VLYFSLIDVVPRIVIMLILVLLSVTAVLFYMGLVFENYFISLASQLLHGTRQTISRFKPLAVSMLFTFTY